MCGINGSLLDDTDNGGIDVGEECKIRANNDPFIKLVETLVAEGEMIAVDFLTMDQHLVRIGGLEYLIDFSQETVTEV